MIATRSFRSIAPIVAVALSACSGGGDGPGDGGGGGASGFSVSVDRTSLEFAGIGYGGGPQYVHFTLTGGSGTYYGSVVQDKPGMFMWKVDFTGPTTATVELTPWNPPAGRTSGNVTFRLCRDSACTSIAWSKAIPYTVTVFTVSTQSLTVTGTESLASEVQAISIDPADTGHQLSATVGPSTPWLTVARDVSSVFQVTASAQTLAAGRYQGQIVVAPVEGGTAKTVPVTFTVAPAIIPPADATHTLNMTASLTGSIPVAFQGGLAPTWTAVKDKAWLTLTQPSGTGAGSVEYAIDPGALGSVANWSNDVATIVIDPAGLMTSASVRLTLQKQLPEVYMLSPQAIAAGTEGTVHVFGRGLSQITSPDGIAVSGASSVTTTIPAATDKEASVTVAPLAAGRATVSVPNPFGVPTRAVDLAVDPEGLWSAVKVPRSGSSNIRCAVFDPLRNAVYAANIGQNTVDRYHLVSGAWQPPDSIPVPSLSEVGLSADRRTLYVTSGEMYATATFQAFDPDTLQTAAGTYSLPYYQARIIPSISRTSCIQATNNARLWFNADGATDVTYFDVLASHFAELPGPTSLTGPGYYASPDGARMVIEQPYGWSAPYLYTSADDQIVKPNIPVVYNSNAVASRDGRVVVIDDYRVYSADTWTLRGNIPAATGTGNAGRGTQVSPDGTKVYRMVQEYPSNAIVRIDVYDAAGLVKLGEIPVTDQAGSCTSGYATDCIPSFLIGPLGDVFFMVGNQGLVVLPIPPLFAGPP